MPCCICSGKGEKLAAKLITAQNPAQGQHNAMEYLISASLANDRRPAAVRLPGWLTFPSDSFTGLKTRRMGSGITNHGLKVN